MKRNSAGKRGGPDPQAQTEKSGWIRKFCGKGLFREIWKNRYVILRGDQLYICSKEVKDPGGGDEVLDLLDFDRCEELRKNRSRSKKSHSKFRLLRCPAPGPPPARHHTTLVFLALSPEEKESWIQVLNQALIRAKNRVLDQVTVDDPLLNHPTRDRAKIPHTRRPPTRGHLLAVASSSDGALTLDLIHEEDPSPRSRTETGSSRKPHTLPRQQVAPGGRSVSSEKSASLDQIHRASESEPLTRLDRLIQDKIQQTEQLLCGIRLDPGPDRDQDSDRDQDCPQDSGLTQEEEVRRLLMEAKAQWNQAQQVLTQVQELKELYLQLDSQSGAELS